jgi:hypothetical protein
MTTISMRQKDIRPAPARIEFKGMKFLITDRPSDATIQAYLMVSWKGKEVVAFGTDEWLTIGVSNWKRSIPN